MSWAIRKDRLKEAESTPDVLRTLLLSSSRELGNGVFLSGNL
jgi:hypothetical protein